MSVNIDSRGEGVRPTLTTSRMSAYFPDAGITTGAIHLLHFGQGVGQAVQGVGRRGLTEQLAGGASAPVA